MPAPENNLTTHLFCRSSEDGRLAPEWDESRADELRGHFEVGLTVADRYFIKQMLGDGSMGRVFLAQDLRLDRPVAMKVVSHRRPSTAGLEVILQREAKLGASLSHKGVAAVYDFGFHDDKSYTIFEYVEGETLRQLLRTRGPLPLAETRSIIADLAAALDFAHARGLVHRDLKPENICCTKGGEFKILDLGLAVDVNQDLESRTYSGTPAYSSPEQAACRPLDGKSDQYALGLILYEMLTGKQAFMDEDPIQLLVQQIESPPPSIRTMLPVLPERVEIAIQRALSKHPDDRFPTCQALAQELNDEALEETRRHIVPTPVDSRIGFYVGHVAEESLLARQLAEALERKHYSCWYYGRNALPGIPFAEQSASALERSQAIVLLISRPAMQSPDFEREIAYAQRIGCAILPLLIDVSREEFEKLAPSWRRLLGATPIVEFHRVDPLEHLVDKLVASAQALHVGMDRKVAPPIRQQPSASNSQIWATDANQIDILDLDRVLFRNATIDDFLSRSHRHFVSATKGFGKTLLLTCKRQKLTQANQQQGQKVTMVPAGRPYLDFMSEMRSLSARYEKPLSDLSTTKRLWNAAFRISAVSHQSGVIDAGEADEVAAFPGRIQRWLGGTRIQPTVVFKELTTLRVSELNRLIDETENFLDQKMREIHGGVYFFVDKVDQAIRHLSRDAWIAVQAGLIEAAWETMSANSHLKIFASIRQEAFSNYQSDIKSNLFAATTSLDYSDDELRSLLDQLARCYEGSRSFADFLGMNVLRHGRRPAPEDSFQFVRRHTCGRPRDLVAMASEISSKRSSLNEKRLREIVQHTSSMAIVSNIFDEVHVFLSCLGDRDARLRFLAGIPGNILEKTEAIRVCEEFNGLPAGTLDHFGEDSSEIFHPFRDLYLAGLLGYVQSDPETGQVRQRFRRPHDPVAHSSADLPSSLYYLLHPALDSYIQSQRTRAPYLQYQHVPVGDGLVWEPYAPVMMQVEKHLRTVEDRDFSEAAHQIVKRIQGLLSTGSTPFRKVEVQTSAPWKSLAQFRGDTKCEDVLFWLQELLDQLP